MSVNLSRAVLVQNGKIYDGKAEQTNADAITFDNTGTDLVSENVENAIKEVDAKGTPKTDIAYIESGTTASRTYAPGDLIYLSGTLYKVTQNISSGATFTVNTNISTTIVGTEIGQIVQRLGGYGGLAVQGLGAASANVAVSFPTTDYNIGLLIIWNKLRTVEYGYVAVLNNGGNKIELKSSPSITINQCNNNRVTFTSTTNTGYVFIKLL